MLTWRYLCVPALMYKAYAMLLSLQNYVLSKPVLLMRLHALDILLQWWNPYWYNHHLFSSIFCQTTTAFLPLASLNPTIYYDVVIATAFHSFLLPHPSLFCKISLLTDACISTKDHVGFCGLDCPPETMFMSQHHTELVLPLTCGGRAGPASCGVGIRKLAMSLMLWVQESWSCPHPGVKAGTWVQESWLLLYQPSRMVGWQRPGSDQAQTDPVITQVQIQGSE